MSPLLPPAAALRQLDDPVFLRVLALSVLGAAAAFAGVGLAVWYGAHDWLGWNGWLAGSLGGVGAALLAHFLFLPVAGALATLLADAVAAAVERRFYPGLPPARPAPLGAQIWDGLALAGQVLGLQVAALLLTPLLPGGSALLGYAIAAWAIGRGLFVAVAMRRMSRTQARAAYAARRGDVLAQGAVFVAASLLPLVNLLVPVLAVAAMVHVLHAGRPGPGVTRPSRGLAGPLGV